MTPTSKAFLQIHFCVVLWGFTAILGKLITLPALPLVWARMLLVVVALALLPFALSLVALRHMSAFGVQLAVNLEPVYAIVLAIVLLGEQHDVTPMFYFGVAIILAAVFIHPLVSRRRLQHPEMLGTSEAKGVVE